MVSFSSNYAIGENSMVQNMSQPPTTTTTLPSSSSQVVQPSFLTRMAMRISRSRWFTFLRRVFHYQNGPRSNLGSNPFNSSTWMMLELIALLVQIISTIFTLTISKNEKPVWPMRVWIVGYDIGCVLNLLLLHGRYHQINVIQGDSDIENQTTNEENRYLIYIFIIFSKFFL
jgi:hypothetical protein